MRLSGLFSTAFLAVLLFCLFSVTSLVAQHGGGGGASSGSSGGSHGGGGGSSSASSSSHSSSGAASHGSGSHASSTHSSTASSASRTRNMRPADGSRHEVETASTQKRGFFSFLRHPFRKPERNLEPANFRHRICMKGDCRVCPVAQVPGKYGCVTPHIELNQNRCAHLQGWSLEGCNVPIQSAADCSGQRAAMERQAQSMEAAEGSRRAECINGNTPACTDLTDKAQNEAAFYQTLKQRYENCQRRSSRSWPFGRTSNTRPFTGIDAYVP